MIARTGVTASRWSKEIVWDYIGPWHYQANSSDKYNMPYDLSNQSDTMEPAAAVVVSAQPAVREKAATAIRRFAGADCSIETMASASAALDSPNLNDSSFVLIDSLLADSNGIDLLRKIRQGQPRAVCVFLCQGDEGAVLHQAIRLGAFDTVLIEELSASLLARVWRQALREKALRAAAEIQLGQLSKENDEVHQLMRALSHDLQANMMLLGDSFHQMKEHVQQKVEPAATIDAEYVEVCLEQSRRLLDDLASLAKTGQVDMKPQAVNVEDCAREVLRQQHELLARRQIVARIHDGLPTVWCHPDRLNQLLTNVIRNAALHGCSDVRGRIDVVPLGASDVRLGHFAVCDNGPGIPPEHAEAVFTAGQRLDSHAEGTGMGLAIVRRIAEHFGGTVQCDTSFNGGARIIIALPVPVVSSRVADLYFDDRSSPSPVSTFVRQDAHSRP